MKRKIQKKFLYEGLGFPIHLLNAPMIQTRGEWTPDIDYNKLQRIVLMSLVSKPRSLTGNQIRFIRKYFGKTLQAFGLEFGTSHVAVIDWEKQGNNPVKINPATEKCIRLFIIDQLDVEDKKFRQSYHEIELQRLSHEQKAKQKKGIETLILDAKMNPLRSLRLSV